jgi:hypothetical protein
MMYGPSVNFQDGFPSFLHTADKSQNVKRSIRRYCTLHWEAKEKIKSYDKYIDHKL